MRIELEGVSKRFGAMRALDAVTFEAAAGARLALVGPNGSGKSTLLRALLGLIEVDGKVRLAGVSPFDHRAELARRLAYVPQLAPQLTAPVGEVLDLVCATRGIDRRAVSTVASKLSLELEPLHRRPFRQLSGGMKQKLLIALALAAKPQLLVMDEPTASLDREAREQFFQLLEQDQSGATVVLCSHRLEELRRLTDEVIALEDGKVVFRGAAAAFVAQAASHATDGRIDSDFHPDVHAARHLLVVQGGNRG